MACKYIRGRKYDSFLMTPHAENYNGKDEADIHESLKEKLAKVTSSKLKNDVEYRELQTEYKFLMKHCTKRLNYIQFVKCADSQCQYCLKNPVKAKAFISLLPSQS